MQDIVDALDRSQPRVDGRHKLLAILTLFHGLRIGEALGIQRRDVRVTDDEITVTIAGNRRVPIFPRFRNDVIDHLDRHVGDSRDAFLFATATGEIGRFTI